jgi:hypothetical protein
MLMFVVSQPKFVKKEFFASAAYLLAAFHSYEPNVINHVMLSHFGSIWDNLFCLQRLVAAGRKQGVRDWRPKYLNPSLIVAKVPLRSDRKNFESL